jgi:hypothetical protein
LGTAMVVIVVADVPTMMEVAVSAQEQASAGVVLARAGTSIVAFVATSRGSAPSLGRKRCYLLMPTMSRRSRRCRMCDGVVV